MRLVTLGAAALALGTRACLAAPHPLLARGSPWPACHGDASASDSTPFPGPSGADAALLGLEAQLLTRAPFDTRLNTFLPISCVFGGDGFVWATSVSSVLLMRVDPMPPHELLLFDLHPNGPVDLAYHGAYSFVGSDGAYFSSSRRGFRVFRAVSTGGGFRVVQRGEFTMPAKLGPDELVVGMLPLYPQIQPPTGATMAGGAISAPEDEDCSERTPYVDGNIALVTSKGRVVVVARAALPFGDDFRVQATLLLPRHGEGVGGEEGSGRGATDHDLGITKASVDGKGQEVSALWPEAAGGSDGGSGDREGFVSNSLALDPQGGIYVVSSEALHKVAWTEPPPKKPSAPLESSSSWPDGALRVAWTTPYGHSQQGRSGDGARKLWPGRLGKGSGSTPSLMGGVAGGVEQASSSSSEHPLWVVITDGGSPMRLLVVRASDGLVAGVHTVTFDQAPAASAPHYFSQSEQSVVVAGNKAVVVNNFLPAERVPVLCTLLGPWLPDKATLACPFLLGAAPYPGVEQVEVDLATGAVRRTTWVNKRVQCASSIPAAAGNAAADDAADDAAGAAAAGHFYCLGMRATGDDGNAAHDAGGAGCEGPTREGGGAREGGGLARPLAALGCAARRLLARTGLWPAHEFVVYALRWGDGGVAWALPLGSGWLFNPAYAAVQVGRDKDVVVGTVGGVLRVTAKAPATSPETSPGENRAPAAAATVSVTTHVQRAGNAAEQSFGGGGAADRLLAFFLSPWEAACACCSNAWGAAVGVLATCLGRRVGLEWSAPLFAAGLALLAAAALGACCLGARLAWRLALQGSRSCHELVNRRTIASRKASPLRTQLGNLAGFLGAFAACAANPAPRHGDGEMEGARMALLDYQRGGVGLDREVTVSGRGSGDASDWLVAGAQALHHRQASRVTGDAGSNGSIGRQPREVASGGGSGGASSSARATLSGPQGGGARAAEYQGSGATALRRGADVAPAHQSLPKRPRIGLAYEDM